MAVRSDRESSDATVDGSIGGDIDPEEFRQAGHALIDWVAEYLSRPEQHRVMPAVDPGALLDKLPAKAPEQPSAQAEILADFQREILPHVLHWNHPGFMAYFSAGGSSPGVLAETLIAALNNIGLLWHSSPALAEVEQGVLRWLAGLLCLPSDWFGMIHDTASTASLHAIIGARERAAQAAREAGSELDLNRIVIYCSEEAHSSIEKTMAALGRGFAACRQIPCDDRFALKPDALRAAIDADKRNGYHPIAIVATVGTTAFTGVDPVDAMAEIAVEHSLWLHVDAAYAGAVAMLPEKRHHFAGCERADSFVVNPHKWLFVPMDFTALYVAHPQDLRRALSRVPEILSSREHPRAPNFMEYSVPLGRRFRALKLWYVLRSLGSAGIAATLREHLRLASLLAEWVDAAPDFERTAPTDFSLVCIRHIPPSATPEEQDAANERLLNAVNASGEFFLSHAKHRERYVIRVAIGNIRTTETHVRRLWDLLQTLARDGVATRTDGEPQC